MSIPQSSSRDGSQMGAIPLIKSGGNVGVSYFPSGNLPAIAARLAAILETPVDELCPRTAGNFQRFFEDCQSIPSRDELYFLRK
jgi:hypothetical protein